VNESLSIIIRSFVVILNIYTSFRNMFSSVIHRYMSMSFIIYLLLHYYVI